MATVEKGLVSKSYLTATADAIRSKLGTTTTYKPSEFADAIGKIGGGTAENVLVGTTAKYKMNANIQIIYKVLRESTISDDASDIYDVMGDSNFPVIFTYIGKTISDDALNNISDCLTTIAQDFTVYLIVNKEIVGKFASLSNNKVTIYNYS